MKIKAIQIRKGNILVHNGELCLVTESIHVTPGKGQALMQVKMKRLKDGSNVEQRFRPDESVEKAVVTTKEMQYLYADGQHYHFMDNETYDQVVLDEEFLGDSRYFLVEGMTVQVQFYETTAVGIELPPSVELEVVETEPNLKGATVSSSYKPAKLENGLTIQVPPFIEVGDRIRVDTRELKYLERAK